MKLKRKHAGFTLVELIIVVVIIGILVAIAIPVYQTTVSSAEKRACQANIRIINAASSHYWQGNGAFPPALTNLLGPDYLSAIPHCPTAGVGVEYLYDPSNGKAQCTIIAHQ